MSGRPARAMMPDAAYRENPELTAMASRMTALEINLGRHRRSVSGNRSEVGQGRARPQGIHLPGLLNSIRYGQGAPADHGRDQRQGRRLARYTRQVLVRAEQDHSPTSAESLRAGGSGACAPRVTRTRTATAHRVRRECWATGIAGAPRHRPMADPAAGSASKSLLGKAWATSSQRRRPDVVCTVGRRWARQRTDQATTRGAPGTVPSFVHALLL